MQAGATVLSVTNVERRHAADRGFVSRAFQTAASNLLVLSSKLLIWLVGALGLEPEPAD